MAKKSSGGSLTVCQALHNAVTHAEGAAARARVLATAARCCKDEHITPDDLEALTTYATQREARDANHKIFPGTIIDKPKH